MKHNFLSFPEANLKEIVEASENNRLVFFIGAGFSKFSETDLIKIPDWNELIDELKDELNEPRESDFLKVAQLYYLKFGEHRYTNKIKSSIKELAPSSFHKSLFDFNPHYIITTNWDNLIEKTTDEIALAYDLICSDTDLAHSQLDRKIIKMHGDFTQHNFVFKEDDYLQYSQNFPLIENYIKGIFSTHTIVFLGYSYSDYNLKQIVSWISNISKATPQKYLLQNSFDNAHAQYLRNHGISLLTPKSPFESFKDLYDAFFNKLKVIYNPEKYIIETYKKISKEIKIVESNLGLYEVARENRIRDLLDLLNKRLIKHINGKFNALNQYKTLLPEQVSKKLTNSTIDYTNAPSIILTLHNQFLTEDYNKYIREVNKIYVERILNHENKDPQIFVSILNKALISQIKFDNNNLPIEIKNRSKKIDNLLISKISFKYQRNDLEILLINNELEAILNFFSSEVQFYLNEKNYIMATIYMFNHDSIYKVIENNASNEHSDHYRVSKEIITKSSPFNYKNKVRDFPIFLQDDLQDLIQILEFNEIYRAYYQFDIKSQENRRHAEQRKDGGMAWDVNEYTLRAQLYPYIYFILGNDIFVESFTETKKFFRSILLKSFEHYLIENRFHINIMDLFILIKYCKYNIVTEFAHKLVDDKKFLNIYKLSPKEIALIKKYLLDVLENISQLFDFKDPISTHRTNIDEWFDNLLIILGFVEWKPKEFEKIINTIIPVFEYRTQNIRIYQNIKYLLWVSWNLYENSHSSILKIIDIMLNKIIEGEFNGNDEHILEGNILGNIYAISINKGYIYSNLHLLKDTLCIISNKNVEWKKFYTENLLINLKQIGNNEIRDLIDHFIISEILNQPYETAKDYMLILTLIANDSPIPDKFIEDLDQFIEESIPDKLFKLEFIKARIDREMPRLLEFLVNEKDLSGFKNILQKLKDKLNQATTKQ